MKLEALFTVKQNKLFSAKDDSAVNPADFEKIIVKWSEVELSDEVYNEELLANLRDNLKALEAQNKFAILIPEIDKTFETSDQKEAFINAMNHTARRVKDCVSVAGFELPSKLLEAKIQGDFIDTLAKKHAQYVYFAGKSDVEAFNLAENLSSYNVVIQ